jgi:hypothetical protein
MKASRPAEGAKRDLEAVKAAPSRALNRECRM